MEIAFTGSQKPEWGGRGLVRLQLPQIFAKIVLLPLDKDSEKEKKQNKKILTSWSSSKYYW